MAKPDSAAGTADPEESGGRLRRLAGIVSLVLALILVVVKLGAWFLTGSVALLTSAVDALVDAGASLATLIGVHYAGRPADREHRYGHGKGEALAALMQAVFLGGAALALVFQSVQRLIAPEPLLGLSVGLWVIGISIAVTGGLVLLQSWVIRRTGSTAIQADRTHYLADLAVNIAVLAALATTWFTGWTRADPAFALAISLVMLWNARGIWGIVVRQLLDRELPPGDRTRIGGAILGSPGVRSFHDLRTRNAGDRVFVEFHVEVDGALTVSAGHEIGDAAEAAVRQLFPAGAEVMAHLEPSGISDDRLDHRVQRASALKRPA